MKSIQSRLLIMLLVFIILPYFLSMLLIYQQTKKNVERHELENSREQIGQASEDLEQYFDDIVNLPYILYRNPDLFMIFEKGFERSLYFNQLEIYKGMTTFYLMRNEIRQVRLYIEEGKNSFTVYNAMISSRKRQPDLLKQASIQKLINSDSNFLIEPPHQIENYNNTAIMPPSDKAMVLTIHHKILDALSKEFLGIITIDIDLDKFARISNHFLQKNKESVLLSDSDGHVVYASDAAMIGKAVPAELQKKINQSAAGAQFSNGDIIFSKTLSEPLNQWHFVKITSSKFLFNDVRKTAYTNIIVGVIVGVLGLIMIAIISYKITRPIKLLSRKVLSIEGGNMNAPFDDKREDEIGNLERHIKEMMNRINRHIDREYKLEIENRKNQHRALKSQINPHFLYNSLQSIGAVALFNESPRVYQLVVSLSKMMRYSIRVDQQATVRSEVDYVRAYLNLQEERFQTDFSYSIDIPKDILGISVPSMILQPLVENFFKHCYEEGFEHAHLRIYGEIRSEYLDLVVENNGRSMTDDELTALKNKIYAPVYEGNYSPQHIGLKNIHDRLVLNYDPTAGILLDSMQGQGFSVQLVIPLYLKED
ncbi:two-component system sensor histidine kinase YesM [Paenibacillus sp. V4I3]|uniref:cache domain-containing sensor histidine kinase n=1 Tax=unclassified Paenibacillus TaxID=185978 RepID=UPI0027882A73|nr:MULTISPECIES: sensor histidine kinase [unclassified Paenibacillus]MDQ0877459.1 two-component system sensor histidine kinase YesM [Paenibacillus sp. V4I3]MDQ0886675.1 two-component system sensor histidine kinase YesM [Paenibacillus sp. V4I9]